MKKTLLICLFFLLITTLKSQYIYEKNDKYGLKDSSGKIIVKAKYDLIAEFGYLDVTSFKFNEKYGMINANGVVLIEPKFDYIKPHSFLDPTFDAQMDGKWGVIDLDGMLVVKPKYNEPVNMSIFGNYTIVSMAKSIEIASGYTTKMYGVIDNSTFIEIVKPKYASIDDKGFGYFKVRLDDKIKKYGLIDSTDKLIFEIKYDDIFAVSKEVISYKKSTKWVLVNSKGYSVSSYEYDNVFRLFENRAKVKREGKFGYINEKGKEVIPCQYDEAEVKFVDGKVKVTLNKVKMEIDVNGNEKTELKTIKPRANLEFIGEDDENSFNSINFKTKVSDSNNLKKVDQYLSYYLSYKSIFNAVDNLVSEASNNKTSYKEFVNYLYSKYLNSMYVCYDAIPIYVANKYMCNTDAPYGGGYWLLPQNKIDICDYCKKNVPSLCGQIVSNVSLKLLPQTNSNYFKLNSIKSKYTLLFFWKNECPNCEKQIQYLVANYLEFKKLGVEILGISLDENAKDKCEQLIVSNGIEWTNTVDIGMSFTKQLNVLSLPGVFLLDSDKRIIYKKITAEQAMTYVQGNQ